MGAGSAGSAQRGLASEKTMGWIVEGRRSVYLGDFVCRESG